MIDGKGNENARFYANSSPRPDRMRPTVRRCRHLISLLISHAYQSEKERTLTDETKETQDGTKDFHDENLDKQLRIRRIRHRRIGTGDADRDTTEQVAHAHSDPRPEEQVAGQVIVARPELVGRLKVARDLGAEDDGHDDAVDGHNFAEDDTDQVLGRDPGCTHTRTEDRSAGDEDSPGDAFVSGPVSYPTQHDFA